MDIRHTTENNAGKEHEETAFAAFIPHSESSERVRQTRFVIGQFNTVFYIFYKNYQEGHEVRKSVTLFTLFTLEN